MRGGKDHALTQSLDHAQGTDQLPVAEPGAEGRQHIEDGADAQAGEEHHLAAELAGQLTRRHLGDDIAPEEAAQQQGFRLFRPVVLLKFEKIN